MVLSIIGTLLAFGKNPEFVNRGFLLLRVVGLLETVRSGLSVFMHRQIILKSLLSFRPLFLSFLIEIVRTLLSLGILMLFSVAMKGGEVMYLTLLRRS